MPDPFAAALGVLLQAPGSVAGIYNSVESGSIPIRAIQETPSETVGFKIGKAIVDTCHWVIAVADVAHPRKNDTITLENCDILTVLAEPMLDAEGISWRVQVG